MSKDVLNQIKAEEAAGDRAMQEGRWEEWYSAFCKRGAEKTAKERARSNELKQSLPAWKLWLWKKKIIKIDGLLREWLI